MEVVGSHEVAHSSVKAEGDGSQLSDSFRAWTFKIARRPVLFDSMFESFKP